MTGDRVTYERLGASSSKDEVHDAIKDVDKGLFPGAFCKVIDDVFCESPEHCVVFHADGAGTKSILAYLAWKEGAPVDVFGGISQDALVMNVDDIACIGITSGFIISNTIGRNKFLVPGEVIGAIIAGYERMASMLQEHGIKIQLCGGETADVGDLVRTVIVDSTVAARATKDSIISASSVVPGDVLVGLSSTGKATYESTENSGISSNGITLARHAVLDHSYVKKYPEIADPRLEEGLAYSGDKKLDDKLPGSNITVGDALLSPTRTYLPVVRELLQNVGKEGVHGIFHNTGGGQSKCIKFGKGVRYVKDDLFDVPPVFSLIQQAANVDWDEMYRVFNMGHRLEVACLGGKADEIIAISKAFGIDAKVIGRVEKSQGGKNELRLETPRCTLSMAENC